MKYNTRIAPSPTGDFHLGTARTAYFNWLAARSTGGKFYLRIDDTDKSRSKQEYVDVIIDTMTWLGLDYDNIVYQSDRFSIYLQEAERLVELDQAVREGNSILTVDSFPHPKEPAPLVLIKSDGSPSYHWASCVDDCYMDINWIIRGTDHESNLPKHQMLWSLLYHDSIDVSHVGLIHMNKKKLSKRDGAASLLTYRDRGYDPDAMLNFMLRLGWGPKEDTKDKKIISKNRALELFVEHGNLRKPSCNMDLNHLDAYNRKYKNMKRS